MTNDAATYHVDHATPTPRRTEFGTNRRAALDFWRANGGLCVMVSGAHCYTIRTGADHDAHKRALAGDIPSAVLPRSGRRVLAHDDGRAKTYANRTQADRAASKHGARVIQLGRPYFVALD